ncbi:MAG TPA: UDP-N-acetylmuramoyl-L-alanyl-D-glutamate--2,6-diaminopimelate ligase, partial [Candidatus Dormibacteraeota bacterium]|nr:UDP-N-acetylmuramoyl-L-alanyl-D-glutamate--2,6-diaminopimelate ligase [Candidatus Dormibacteraeota bacterium]
MAIPGRVDLLDPQPWSQLARCVAELGGQCPAAGPLLTGLAWDSRAVRAGDLFVALRGEVHDGHDHVAQALQAGASALVVEAPAAPSAPHAVVADSRRALGAISARLFGDPGRGMRLVGVTGTDGKTTTTHLTAAVLLELGLQTCALSTVALVSRGGASAPNRTDMTTPEAPILHRFLAEQRRQGVSTGVLEVTSHALVQQRVDHCRFEVAVVTNFTPEHLDFHGSLHEYARAKLHLLDLLGGTAGSGGAAPVHGTLVTNAGDPALDRFRLAWPGPHLGFGLGAGAVVADELDGSRDGTSFRLLFGGEQARVRLRLPGPHNVLNALAAASVALALGGGPHEVAAGLGRVTGVAGRLQRVVRGQPFEFVVDFAHTANGLEQVLRALRSWTTGRLVVVFGSAGGRDALKRPALGRAAARLADHAILTTDDPRREDPAVIADEISAGMESEGWRRGERFEVVLDRTEAVRVAIAAARPGDTVLLAGKGGQTRMYLRDGSIPWDDVAVADEALAGAGYRTSLPGGPPCPG